MKPVVRLYCLPAGQSCLVLFCIVPERRNTILRTRTIQAVVSFVGVVVGGAATAVVLVGVVVSNTICFGCFASWCFLPHPRQNVATLEPLGRVHEIFGPVHTPHYTVRVEGAANKHVLVTRYQTAYKKLVKMETVRG